MKSDETKLIKRNITIVTTAMLCIVVFVISFSKNPAIPSWDDIFKFVKLTSYTDTSEDYVKIMNVGQGDSILICSNGYSALIDAGLAEAANDICLDLDEAGVKDINAMLITHLHMDHVGGLQRVIEKHSIKNLIIPDLLSNGEGLPAASEAKQAVINSSGGVYTAVQGMNLNIGEFEITILAYYNNLAEENNKSIIAMAEIDGVKFLLTGDAETEAENALLKDGLNIDCDVLKVGHHGSNSSSQDKFIKAASPEYAAISVGKNNMYSHPNKDTLETLEENNVKTYRTDRDGDITFYVEDGKIDVKLENDGKR